MHTFTVVPPTAQETNLRLKHNGMDNWGREVVFLRSKFVTFELLVSIGVLHTFSFTYIVTMIDFNDLVPYTLALRAKQLHCIHLRVNPVRDLCTN